MAQNSINNFAEAIISQVYREGLSVKEIADHAINLMQEKHLSKREMEQVSIRVSELINERELGPVVSVTSARKLTQKELGAVTHTLQAKFKGFQLNEIVDPKLIGGMRIQVGDNLYDYSIQHSLLELRSALINHSL